MKRLSSTLVVALLAFAIGAQAEENETLKEQYQRFYETFGQNALVRLSIVSGPNAVKMRRDQMPGKQWMVTTGNYNLKLTIQDKANCPLEPLIGRLEKVPAVYLSAGVAASDDGEEGIAVYADLGGATSTGGVGYVDILPTADAVAIVRATGRALAEESRLKDEKIPEQWMAASEADGVRVAADVSPSWDAEIEAYAELYAVCSATPYTWIFTDLLRRSPKRCALWTGMVSRQDTILGKTPAVATVSEAQIAEAKRLGVPVSFTNSLGMKFVLVPAGKFMMGSRDSAKEVAARCIMPQAQMAWFVDESPRHEVTLTAFYMSIHEVTQGQHGTLVKPEGDPRNGNWELMACPAEFQGATKPAVFVGRNDAETFFKALNQREAKEGRTYFLPTEAQWEYACRAGSTTPFSFGETLSTDQANYNGFYTYADGKKGENRAETLPVGSLPANAWGLHEMHGNVAEWCSDWYADYTGNAETDPKGPAEKPKTQERVVRGGSWRSYPGACRSACRLMAGDGFRKSHIGFRAVCAIPVKTAEPEEKR